MDVWEEWEKMDWESNEFNVGTRTEKHERLRSKRPG
jgi:hypothetical protein